jgi:hypothetical protein
MPNKYYACSKCGKIEADYIGNCLSCGNSYCACCGQKLEIKDDTYCKKCNGTLGNSSKTEEQLRPNK